MISKSISGYIIFLYFKPLAVSMPKSMYKKKGKRSSSKNGLSTYDKCLKEDKKKISKKDDMKEFDQGLDYWCPLKKESKLQ